MTAIFSILAFSSCYTVRFTKSNGKKHLVYSLRNDGYLFNRSLIEVRMADFQNENLNAKTDTFIHPRKYEYFTTENLKSLCAKNGVTAVVYWYTNCPTTTNFAIKTARLMQKQNLNVILLSVEYEFNSMDKNLYYSSYFNQSYVMPHFPYGKHLLTKEISFIKHLDSNFYSIYKDDVADNFCFFVDQNGKIIEHFGMPNTIQLKPQDIADRLAELSKTTSTQSKEMQ